MSANPKLKIINGHAYANSLDLARHFHKAHKDVLRAIEKRLQDCSEAFGQRNFAPTSYTDRFNRQQRVFNLSRDGFAFVAMNFTGKEAAKWQEAYINAFNELEHKLNSRIIKDKHFGQLKFHFPDAAETIEESLPFMTVSYAIARLTELGLMIPPVSRNQLIGLIKRRTLAGFKNDREWCIYAESFDRFIKMRRGQFV